MACGCLSRIPDTAHGLSEKPDNAPERHIAKSVMANDFSDLFDRGLGKLAAIEAMASGTYSTEVSTA